ncbi:MAG: hypothetical protein AAGF31_02145 [Planctomycetota bacterium]
MTLLDRLEKRFGGYALENSMLFLIAGQILVFGAQVVQNDGAGDLFARLELDPSKVYAGEVWRLVTFMFLAPLRQSPIFVIFFWYLLYMMSGALEQAWSVFKFNVYCGLSYFSTVAAAFIAEEIAPGAGVGVGDYLYGSVFFAFARLFPDYQFMLFFVLPVKVKWLALIQWVFYGLAFSGAVATGDWFTLLTVTAAVLNFFLFFGGDLWRDVKQGHRRHQHRARTLKAKQRISHECRVCGLTREQAPRTAFRYCSKCAGQQCYCPDHIHNHEHVTAEPARDESDVRLAGQSTVDK